MVLLRAQLGRTGFKAYLAVRRSLFTQWLYSCTTSVTSSEHLQSCPCKSNPTKRMSLVHRTCAPAVLLSLLLAFAFYGTLAEAGPITGERARIAAMLRLSPSLQKGIFLCKQHT
eukprot:365583-Chlamydomonas_euryale.AAC.3